MNLTDPKYSSFALVKEMLETPEIIRSFNPEQTKEMAEVVKSTGRLFFTGEGSSRIFPAKCAIRNAMRKGLSISLATAGSLEAAEFDLTDWAVIGASNSGQTKEVVSLFQKLAAAGHEKRFAVTANQNTKLEETANQTVVLSCGKEDAVAATKSVVEQGLVYQSLLCNLTGGCMCDRSAAADAAKEVMTAEYDAEMLQKIAASPILYFAGRNNGVAEELRLKTNEITRKKSDYLEGTYLLHGIEEVMNAGETIILMDPFESECQKIKELLVDAIGVNVVAVAPKQTIFPTIVLPTVGCSLMPYLYLMAGWNLLVQIGITCGINLDKPTRARKVGNAFEG
ncbi:MAG: sugar isomerase [Planctomycetia bacterium]|nr:sugar isomerase [Planctomycetia bacterium]